MGSEDPAGGERAATDALVRQANSHPESGVDWREVGSVSARFLCVMHVFRWASEPGTRKEGAGLGGRYAGSVASLHGWSDGDPFYVNFVGHPMQGAVAGRIFLLNDRQFRSAEFGRSAPYWKGKLRSAAFAWAFSTQFEIGPLSEASIGHVQRDFPQQGFVDHVVTPAAGLAWMLAEDALDRYAITWVEDRTPNRWVRIAARTGMNPTRSFANLVSGRAPWHRDSRAGVLQYERRIPPPAISQPRSFARDIPAPFEFTVVSSARVFGGNPCAGGGAEAAWRPAPTWQVAFAVDGCKMLGLRENVSGDALVFQLGPRWSPSPRGKWLPYADLLVGGVKVTQERLLPEQKALVMEANRNLDPSLAYSLHDQYTKQVEGVGLAVSGGAGVDCKVSPAVAIRVARFDYMRTTLSTIGRVSLTNSAQVTTGLVLRIGTW